MAPWLVLGAVQYASTRNPQAHMLCAAAGLKSLVVIIPSLPECFLTCSGAMLLLSLSHHGVDLCPTESRSSRSNRRCVRGWKWSKVDLTGERTGAQSLNNVLAWIDRVRVKESHMICAII